MSVSLDRGTTIGTLRLLAAAADPHTLRMRGGTVLGTLDLQPPAMPEQSILCIRRLHDPLPGGIDLRSSAAPRPAAWEVAMRGAVGDAMRRAARPALGPVPASTEAVLFADRAELLACAARDALRGALALHWWWTHLLGGERSHAAVVREWMRAPAYVPAAVELLAAWREIAAFALTLAPPDAVRLLEAVLRVHALPAPAFHLVAALTATSAPSPPRPAAEAALPPWRTVVADLAPVLTALPIEAQSFIAVALMLRRAPALARSERFVRESVAWIESEKRGDRSRGVPVAPRAADHRAESLRRDLASGTVRASPPSPLPSPPATRERGASARPLATRSDVQFPPLPGVGRAMGEGGQGGEAPTVPLAEHLPDAVAPGPPPVDFEIAIDSDFAGVFFLLNVGITLGLYSDFTSPVQCGIDLDIWNFLALTGSALLIPPLPGGGRGWERGLGGEGPNGAAFQSDPIRPLLATLANRKEGKSPSWLGEGPKARASSAQGNALGWEGGLSAPLTVWLAATVERIRERLALAGLDDPSRVVCRYGRVTTTPAHLDVHFSLAAHPIDIRMAGLDRDPGWIPAAGRHVAFHFD
ncbi:MAG TPA: hypothetical protein VH988_09595 [Thermoanaerobaculia bacterium]|nr:hypothetical protein [Thermoanaerobaculia bacterium]